jgi:hypothetical protein
MDEGAWSLAPTARARVDRTCTPVFLRPHGESTCASNNSSSFFPINRMLADRLLLRRLAVAESVGDACACYNSARRREPSKHTQRSGQCQVAVAARIELPSYAEQAHVMHALWTPCRYLCTGLFPSHANSTTAVLRYCCCAALSAIASHRVVSCPSASPALSCDVPLPQHDDNDMPVSALQAACWCKPHPRADATAIPVLPRLGRLIGAATSRAQSSRRSGRPSRNERFRNHGMNGHGRGPA